MEQNQFSENILNIEIDHEASAHLKVATTWARIVAIIGFIGAGLTLLNSFIAGGSRGVGAMVGAVFGSLIYVVIVVIIYTFLLRFANRTAASLSTQNQEQFNAGISSLKSYFTIIGILLIIVLSLCALGLLFFGLGTAFRG